MFSRKYSDEEELQIANLYSIGKCSVPNIALQYKTNNTMICRVLKRRNIAIRDHGDSVRIHSVDYNVFDNMDNEACSYWLGFLYADGCCSPRYSALAVNLSSKDKNHLLALKSFLKTTSPVFDCFDGKYYKSRLSVSHPHLSSRLVELGIIAGRPNFLLCISSLQDHLIHHWIRGFFDGDGCAVRTKPMIIFCGKVDLMEWIRAIFTKHLNTDPCRKITEHRSGLRYLTYGSRKHINLISEWMYSDSTIWLSRKRNIIDSYFE